MIPAITTTAYLLRTVDYRDADRILTLLTREKGKLSALARGARKSQKRYGGALAPFAHIEVVITCARGRKWDLSEAALLNANDGLSRDLSRLTAASYLLEIVRESIPEETPDHPLFDLVTTIFSSLSDAPARVVPQLTLAATLQFLAVSGLAIGLHHCSACGAAVPPNRPVLFHPARGGIVCTPCGGGPIRLPAEAVLTLQQSADTPLESIRTLSPKGDALQHAEAAIATFLEHHLGHRLKTRSFLNLPDQNRR